MHGIRERSTVYFTAIFFSIVLSCWSAMKVAVINPDAICYLQSAESMAMGMNVAMHLCDQAHWPFYSALIYGVATLTKFSFLHTAYFIDGIFTLISVFTFIAIVRFLQGSTRVLWLAALVILLAHEFNAVRADIVRDHGFWAFYLVSTLFLLRFFHKPRWCYALLWSASLMIATVFRIEGVIFLLALPLVAWVIPGQRFKHFMQLNVLTLLVVVGIGFGLWQHPQINTEHLGRVNEVQFQLLHGLSAMAQNFQITAQAIAQHALNRYSAHEAMLILFLVLVSWYLIQVIANLSLIYTVLVVYAGCRRLLTMTDSARWVLRSYIVLNVLITAGFLAQHMFLSGRYLVALSLILMLWVPFALDGIYKKSKPLFALAVLLIVLSALGGIFNFGYSKQYIRDAGIWLQQNLPQNATLYSNDYQVMYYSHRFGHDIFVKIQEFKDPKMIVAGKWKQYDYVALRFNKNDVADNEMLRKAVGAPVQVFANKRGDEVVIYQIKVHK